jgi:hypothetical protein
LYSSGRMLCSDPGCLHFSGEMANLVVIGPNVCSIDVIPDGSK